MSVETYFQPISDQQLYEFFAEFGGTRESVENDLETLKEWMRKTPYLPEVKDDKWLLNFLLRSKNSLESTKRQLEKHFVSRALMPEIFENRDPCEKGLKWIFLNTVYIPCPKLTPDGYRIIVLKAFHKTENTIPTAEDVLKAAQLVVDILSRSDTVRGYIVLEDLGNLTPAFFAMLIPIMGKFIALLTKHTHHRLRKIYLANTAPYMNMAITLVRSFLSKKLNERMVVWHEDVTKFADVLPKEVLPSDFGGDEKSLVELRDLWYEEVVRHRDWLKHIENYKADLDKLPKDYSDGNMQPDMNGSFRKLRID